MTNHTTPIIFNMWTQNTLGTESASAFLRHAFGCFYDAFSQIDLANKPFIPILVFHETLLSFRAVPRSRPPLRLHNFLNHNPTPLHQKTLHFEKSQDPPEEARKRFAALVTINELDYRFKLTATFQRKHSTTQKQQ